MSQDIILSDSEESFTQSLKRNNDFGDISPPAKRLRVSESDDEVVHRRRRFIILESEDEDELPTYEEVINCDSEDEKPSKRKRQPVSYKEPESDDELFDCSEILIEDYIKDKNILGFKELFPKLSEKARNKIFINLTQNDTGHIEFIKFILKDPMFEFRKQHIHKAMLKAIDNNYIALVHALVENKINLRWKNDIFLKEAVRQRRSVIIKILLENHVPMNMEAINRAIRTGRDGYYYIIDGAKSSVFIQFK